MHCRDRMLKSPKDKRPVPEHSENPVKLNMLDR